MSSAQYCAWYRVGAQGGAGAVTAVTQHKVGSHVAQALVWRRYLYHGVRSLRLGRGGRFRDPAGLSPS